MDPHQEYTLPGVMRYLQTEWQRSEREKIQWNLERAEMRSRITKLESENKTLRKSAASHERHAQMLRARLETSLNTNGSVNLPEPVEQDAGEDLPAPEPESQAVSEQVAKYAREIRTLLEFSGALPDDRLILPATIDEGLPDKNLSGRAQLNATLTGFGAQSHGIGLPDDWIVLGGPAGIVYLYDLMSPANAVPVSVVAELGDEITKIVFDWNCDELVVGTRSKILRFSIDTIDRSEPKFTQVAVEDLEVVDIVVGRCIVAAATPQGIKVWDEQAQAHAQVSETEPTEEPAEAESTASNEMPSIFIDLPDVACLTVGEERTGEVSVVAALRLRATVIVLDPFTGREIRRMALPAEAGGVTSIVSIEPAFTSAAVGFDTGDLAVINLHKGIVISQSSGAHSGAVRTVSVLKSTLLLSTSTDGCVSLWTLPSLAWAGRLFTHDITGGGAWATSWIDETEARRAITVGSGDSVARVYKI